MKTNASEPLMKCRKGMDGVETGGAKLLWEKLGRCVLTARVASGMKVA